MKNYKLVLLLFFLMAGLCSCSRTLQAPPEEEKYPELVLKNATYAFGRSGDHPISFKASDVVIYSDSTELKDVTFDSPEAFINGHCDYVVVTQDNTFASMKGNVKLVKTDDDVIIECAQMNWDNNEGLITCKDEVELTYGGGTYIRAIGFTGKTKTNGYTFEQILEGRYTNEK